MKILTCLAALLFILPGSPAHSQDWPAKTVRIVMPFPPGGSTDLLSRIVAESMSAKWGHPVIVVNQPGAGGNIGAEAVYKAEPDGYTLLSAPPSPLTTNHLIYPKLPYDPAQFTPISVIAAIPTVLLVHPRTGVDSMAGLIALARANPGKLNYASQGAGTTSHLAAELFKSMAGGLDIRHIGYKGGVPAMTDLLGGQVEIMFDNVAAALTHIRSGKVKALAVGSSRPIASLPGVPVMLDTLPGFQSIAWFAIVGPPRTPAAIAEKVSGAVQEALAQPQVIKRLNDLAAEPMGLTPSQSAAFMKREGEIWGGVIRAAGIKLQQ
jgi:tripartite-type tricarboxylate transporter receptor subunit TctC